MSELLLLISTTIFAAIAAIFACLCFFRGGRSQQNDGATIEAIGRLIRAESDAVRRAGDDQSRGLRQELTEGLRNSNDSTVSTIKTLSDFINLQVRDFGELQREFRVTLAGPTTLAAYLNALQMGFRTIAIEKRSSEVWQVLAAVRSEFGKYNGVVQTLASQLSRAVGSVDKLGTRTRVMARTLKAVELDVDDTSAQKLLGLTPEDLALEDDDTDTRIVEPTPVEIIIPEDLVAPENANQET